jgi:hypothetical protein
MLPTNLGSALVATAYAQRDPGGSKQPDGKPSDTKSSQEQSPSSSPSSAPASSPQPAQAVPGAELEPRGPYGNCSGASGACNAAGGGAGNADFKKFKDKFKKVAKNKAKICDIIVYYEVEGGATHMVVVAALNDDGTPKLTLGQNGSPPQDGSISPDKTGNVTLNPVGTLENSTKPVEDKDWNVYTPNDNRNPTADIIQAQKDANQHPDPKDQAQRLAWLKLLKLCHDRNLAVFNAPTTPEEPKKEVEKSETPKEKPTQMRSATPGIPGESGFYNPGQPPGTGTFYVATDGATWCTFGDGTGNYVAIKPTDDGGVPVAFGTPGTPPNISERTPVSGDRTPTISSRPPPPASSQVPMASGSPPDTPTTTDAPPTAVTPPTADTPPQIPDTIFVKTSEAVLEGGQTGSELQNQTVKLVFTKPDLPGTGASKTAQDTGFDRDPAQCTTGAGGECKIQVHPDDRPLYGLASSGAKPGHYRLDLNLLKHSGAVAETTGKTVPDLKNAALAGGNIAASEFKIGNRKFTRVGIDQPYGRSEDRAAYSRALGSNAETDYCRTKKPGPPLGLEPSSLGALNHELPEAALKLDGLVRAGRTVR